MHGELELGLGEETRPAQETRAEETRRVCGGGSASSSKRAVQFDFILQFGGDSCLLGRYLLLAIPLRVVLVGTAHVSTGTWCLGRRELAA